jgi:coenzyme F420-reducing hydrogenase delta subunit
MTQATELSTENKHIAKNGKPKIIGFVCEWSLGRNDIIHEDGTVKGYEHIKTIKIPCSGFVKTEWVTVAFENNAQGVFVLGCPLGDCHFNEGNFIINERLSQHVTRLTNRKTIDDAGRVAELYLGVTANSEFTQSLEDFSRYIESLPPLAAPVKKAKGAAKPAPKAAAPVPAAGGES